MARVSLMILSLRHTTNIGCAPPTSVVQRKCRFCAPEEADVCSLGALTVRCLCNIAHSQDHPSMPSALGSRTTMGAHGDSEAVRRPSSQRSLLCRLKSSLLRASMGCRSANFRTAIVFQLSIPTFRTKGKAATVCSGAAKKSATYQSLRSHSGSRDAVARDNQPVTFGAAAHQTST